MTWYIIRRLLYTIPVWLGVILITFVLFNLVNRPEDLARNALGKNANDKTIQAWVEGHGYHLPRFIITDNWRKSNPRFSKLAWHDSQFFGTVKRLGTFQFGNSDKTHRPISEMITEKIGPSLQITIPAFLLGLLINISLSLFIAMYRGSLLDVTGVFITVLLMSIPILIYLIGLSYLNGVYLKTFPSYGTIALPILISIVAGLGGGIRFYRTVFLDQVGEDYTRTARAKGLSQKAVMFRHVLPNSLIPILTSAVMQIPFLITGSLLLETFFGIPGLGDMFLTAINSRDFTTIQAFVYLGALLYMLGTVLTDISYTLVDPRVALK